LGIQQRDPADMEPLLDVDGQGIQHLRRGYEG
jgi:hypothetical protein